MNLELMKYLEESNGVDLGTVSKMLEEQGLRRSGNNFQRILSCNKHSKVYNIKWSALRGDWHNQQIVQDLIELREYLLSNIKINLPPDLERR